MASECVCCRGGHQNVTAQKGDRWCRQCQKDGCSQPKLKPSVQDLPGLQEDEEAEGVQV
jgi:hypothetical protein